MNISFLSGRMPAKEQRVTSAYHLLGIKKEEGFDIGD